MYVAGPDRLLVDPLASTCVRPPHVSFVVSKCLVSTLFSSLPAQNDVLATTGPAPTGAADRAIRTQEVSRDTE